MEMPGISSFILLVLVVTVLSAPGPWPRGLLAGRAPDALAGTWLWDILQVVTLGFYLVGGLGLLVLSLSGLAVVLHALHWLGRDLLESWGWPR